MSGGEDDQVVAEGLDRSHRRTVRHRRGGEQRRQVVTRPRAAILGDAVEHLVELEPDLHLGLVAVLALALQVRVVAREELLGQLEDSLLVFAVDAEDGREHAQRMSLRDLLDEIALALLAERVDQGARALGHDLVEPLDAPRREEPARHLAEVAVLGRVHLDDRAHLAHRARCALGHLDPSVRGSGSSGLRGC